MSIIDEIHAAVPDITKGKTYRIFPRSINRSVKAHVMYVLQGTYVERLIVYRFYGKYKQWWHEVMCAEYEFKQAILDNLKYGKKEN